MLKHARRVFVAILAAAAPLSAQVSITGDAALNSQYQWRGLTTTNRPVWQPDIIVAAPLGKATITATAWASIEGGRYDNPQRDISENGGTRAGLAEYDFVLEAGVPAGRYALAAGVLTYNYPNAAGATSVNNTVEAYVKAKADAPLAPSLTVWHDVHAIQGAYAELGLSQAVGKVSFGAIAGWNFGQSVGDGGPLGYFVKRGFTHADLSAGTSWAVGSVTVAPSLHVIVGGDANTLTLSPSRSAHTKVWIGTALSWSRVLGKKNNANGAGGAAATSTTTTEKLASK